MRIIDLIPLESSVFLNEEKTHYSAQSSASGTGQCSSIFDTSGVREYGIKRIGKVKRGVVPLPETCVSEVSNFRKEKNV